MANAVRCHRGVSHATRRRTRSASWCWAAIGPLVWVVLALLNPRPGWALECSQDTFIYNDWEAEKLHVEDSLFSDGKVLPWGTEVCPITTNHRWLTTWVKVRLANGDTGWVDEEDLATRIKFDDSIHSRFGRTVDELHQVLADLVEMESLMWNYGYSMPEANTNGILLAWVLAGTDADEADAGAMQKEPVPAGSEPGDE